MERLSHLARERREAGAEERERRCLRCGCPVADLPRGCRGADCANCGYPYPLGDCSD